MKQTKTRISANHMPRFEYRHLQALYDTYTWALLLHRKTWQLYLISKTFISDRKHYLKNIYLSFSSKEVKSGPKSFNCKIRPNIEIKVQLSLYKKNLDKIQHPQSFLSALQHQTRNHYLNMQPVNCIFVWGIIIRRIISSHLWKMP